MRLRRAVASVLLGALIGAIAPPAVTAQQTPNDVVWLCKPGATDDPCATPLDAAVVRNDRVERIETTKPVDDPEIDCFYLYPTVSREPTTNADLVVHDDERRAAMAQASRFSSVCRVWAPMYRSITLAGLFRRRSTNDGPDSGVVAYESVALAWEAYRTHENHGRPFVLIGHSQGAWMLETLIAKEIEGNPTLRRQLVSAILLGGNVLETTPPSTSGTFRYLPSCRSATQLHCVIAYSSFSEPPPPNAAFGIPGHGGPTAASPTAHVVCTNPAALAGGSSTLTSYFINDGGTGRPNATPDVPWLAYPGAFTAHCATSGDATYLDVERTTPATTLPIVKPYPVPAWGLHVYDVGLALGDLVNIVRTEAEAERATRLR